MKHNLSTVVVFSYLLIIVFLTQQPQHQSFSESLWSIGKNMPTPRTEIAATIIFDYIYVIGGLEKLLKY